MKLKTYKNVIKVPWQSQEDAIIKAIAHRATTPEHEAFMETETLKYVLNPKKYEMKYLVDSPHVFDLMMDTAIVDNKGNLRISEIILAPLGAITLEVLTKVTQQAVKQGSKSEDNYRYRNSSKHSSVRLNLDHYWSNLVTAASPKGNRDKVYKGSLEMVLSTMRYTDKYWSEGTLYTFLLLNRFLASNDKTVTLSDFQKNNQVTIENEFNTFNGKSHDYTEKLLTAWVGHDSLIRPVGIKNHDKVIDKLSTVTVAEFQDMMDTGMLKNTHTKISPRNQPEMIDSMIVSYRESDQLIDRVTGSNMLMKSLMVCDSSMVKDMSNKMIFAANTVNSFRYKHGDNDIRSSVIVKVISENAQSLTFNEILSILFATNNGASFIAAGSGVNSKEIIYTAVTQSRSVVESLAFIARTVLDYEGHFPTASDWVKMMEDDHEEHIFGMPPTLILPSYASSANKRADSDKVNSFVIAVERN